MNKLTIHDPYWTDNTLHCTYEFNGTEYHSKYTFPNNDSKPNTAILLKLCQWVAVTGSMGLFSLAYFDVINTAFSMGKNDVSFFEKLIFLGLAEFRITNDIKINRYTKIIPSAISKPSQPLDTEQSPIKSPYLLNGGGKDGSVSALLLSDFGVSFTWFQRGNSDAQKNCVGSWTAEVEIVTRDLDERRKNGPYKGHRPMSAIIAMLATLSAYLNGHDAVIASNEASANEGNFIKDGVSINHQYSKSLEFEKDIQTLFRDNTISISYFSLLRPLHELQIAFIATNLNAQQLTSFTSCNNGTSNATWCMKCPKCAFVVLIITAADPATAIDVWGDAAINYPSLRPYLAELLDAAQNKPFECVGTLEECHLAALLLLNRTDSQLHEETKQLFETFTPKSNREILEHPFFTALNDHAIPSPYQPIIPVIAQKLSQWKQRTANTLQ